MAAGTRMQAGILCYRLRFTEFNDLSVASGDFSMYPDIV
jgi:hypothetical protein